MWVCRLFGHKFTQRKGGHVRYMEPPLCWRCGYRVHGEAS